MKKTTKFRDDHLDPEQMQDSQDATWIPGRLSSADHEAAFADKCAMIAVTPQTAGHEAGHAVDAKLDGRIIRRLEGNFIELEGSAGLSTLAAGWVSEYLLGFRPGLFPEPQDWEMAIDAFHFSEVDTSHDLQNIIGRILSRSPELIDDEDRLRESGDLIFLQCYERLRDFVPVIRSVADELLKKGQLSDSDVFQLMQQAG